MIISKKYEVLSQLGEGGMGVVCKVRHTALENVSALKVMSTHFGDNPELVKRFYREARVLARLKHPNIVRVIDIERDEELKFYYFVMEYIEGRPCATRGGFEGSYIAFAADRSFGTLSSCGLRRYLLSSDVGHQSPGIAPDHLPRDWIPWLRYH